MTIKIRRLQTKDASAYLRNEWGIELSPAHLNNLAHIGGGPPFEKDGRFRVYRPDKLDEFASQRLSPLVRSTSELTVLQEKTKREAA